MKLSDFKTQQEVVKYLSETEGNKVIFNSNKDGASILGFKSGKLYNFTAGNFVSDGFLWFRDNPNRWEKYLGKKVFKYKALVVIRGLDNYEFISDQFFKTLPEAKIMAEKETSVSNGKSKVVTIQLIKSTKVTVIEYDNRVC